MVPAGDDGVFAALADARRRQLLDQLSEQGPSTATELAQRYSVSRQAIAKHLSVLADAGLVVGHRQGRGVRYQMVGDQLEGASAWLADVNARWDRRLADLLVHLNKAEDSTGDEPGT
jgi:DNA-binding transcriptional ArsR family regulator